MPTDTLALKIDHMVYLALVRLSGGCTSEWKRGHDVIGPRPERSSRTVPGRRAGRASRLPLHHCGSIIPSQ